MLKELLGSESDDAPEAIAVRRLRPGSTRNSRNGISARGGSDGDCCGLGIWFGAWNAHGPRARAGPKHGHQFARGTNSRSLRSNPITFKRWRRWLQRIRFRVRNFPLKQIIKLAYGIYIKEIVWSKERRVGWKPKDTDIVAKMDAATADRLKKLSPDERMRRRKTKCCKNFSPTA